MFRTVFSMACCIGRADHQCYNTFAAGKPIGLAVFALSGSWMIDHGEIVEEFRCGAHASHRGMIASPCAGYVEQMALGVVNFLQIGIVADRLDAVL